MVDVSSGGNGLTTLCNANASLGAIDVARNGKRLEWVVQKIEGSSSNLSLLPAEQLSEIPALELVINEQRLLLEACREKYDLILLDLGPLAQGRQSAVATSLTDLSILITRAGSSKREIDRARSLLNRLSPAKYMLVLNRASELDPAVKARYANARKPVLLEVGNG